MEGFLSYGEDFGFCFKSYGELSEGFELREILFELCWERLFWL